MKHVCKKSVALILALLMVLSGFAAVPFTVTAANDYTINSTTSTDNYYNLISKTDWDIAPGITESQIVLNNDAGTRQQVLFVMEADLNNEYVKVINSYTGMVPEYGSYSVGVMSQQAAYAEANGYGNVVGAMNTTLSWYSGYSADRVGEPLGFIMLDAEILFDPANCGYVYGNVGFPSVVVINKDFDENGNPRPADIPKVEMPQIRSSADLDGWEEQVIPCSSGYIVKDGKNQYTPNHSDAAPRSVVGIKPDGTVVIMLNDGRQAPYSTGMSMYELAEVMLDLGCSFAVNCDGGGSSTYLSQRPGEDLKVNNSPSDGAERPTTTGILFISTAPANGEFYKAHISSDSEYYTPNSEVTFKAIGTDMAGTTTDIPADVEWKLADDSFGTIANGVFKSNGKEGDVTVQMIYNGAVVGHATITIVLPDIAFKNDTIVIGYGDTMALPIEVTTNGGRNTVAYAPGDIVYTLSDAALGTINGDYFTACDESAGLTNGTITAVICGQTAKAVSAAIRFGKASEIVYDFEDGQLPIDSSKTGNIGGDDAPDTGEYIYGWHINDTRANGYFSYRNYAKKSYSPVGYDIGTNLFLADRTNGKVRNGNYAFGVTIDWTDVTASCHGQMDIHLPESLDLTDATSVGFWMYIPAEIVTDSMQVSAGFRSSRVDYKLANYFTGKEGIDNGGWYYFSWPVLDTYKYLDYIQINSHYTAGENSYNYYQNITYYIDDITVDYSDATIDRENPYFTSMTIADEYTSGVEINGQTITNNTINLMAQAYENTAKANATGLNRNSVKLYVDGVLSTAPISISAGGTITVSDLYLNDGVHTLVMEICDNQGNVGNIVRKLVVNTEKSAVRLEVPATDKLIPTGSLYWVNLVADDLASISSVTTTVNLDYVNEWELKGMEVAYGFEATYYINTHNDAVITFTRTGSVVADTTVLAKLPIRIWTAEGWLDDSGIRKDYISDDPGKQDKYYILTPHAMWHSDGTRIYHLVVSAEAGLVTYVDGSTMTFSANETVLPTEMNRYYTNSDRQGKWSFHICSAGTAQSKAATCFENGYENRVFCVGCACGTVENMGTECDNHNGCGSVIDWGTVIPATGHSYAVVDGVLQCTCGDIFNGTYTDGKFYVDGVVVADGWYEDTYYFIDGVAVTGQYLINGEMHSFDANGIYLPSYSFTGFYHDGIGWTYYQANFLKKGFVVIDGNTHYFDDYTGYAPIGSFTLAGDRVYKVEGEQGKVLGGWDTFIVDGVERRRYYYSLRYYKNEWVEVEGEMYFFDNEGYALIGKRAVAAKGAYLGGYEFADDGRMITPITGPFVDAESGLMYFAQDGVLACNELVKYGNDYYFARSNYLLITWATTISESQANGLLPAGEYQFGADGKLIMQNGPVADPYNPQYLNFYINGIRVYEEGLYEYNGDYYYVRSNGLLLTWGMYISKTNGLLPAGEYKFGTDGKLQMLNGPVVDAYNAAYLNFYKDGIRVYEEGLYEYNGDYYYVRSNGLLLTWGMKITKTNGLLPAGEYKFGTDGNLQMLNGPVEDAYNAAYLNFYQNGIRVYEEGLYEYEGDYYYVRSNGLLLTWGMKITKTNGLLPAGEYKFGADGKLQMLNGPVEDAYNAAYLNFYINGIRVYEEGLYEYDGNYYYVRSNGLLLTWGMYITKTNGLLPEGEYKFGADGKLIMLNGPVVDALNPRYINFYIDGVRVYEEGLYEYNGDYYYVRANGLLLTWGMNITKTNGLLDAGYYEFGADGKLIK